MLTCVKHLPVSFNHACRGLWLQKRINISTKLRLFKVVILPNLLYGIETWAPLATHETFAEVLDEVCGGDGGFIQMGEEEKP